jgi:F-type H+-transporting ATPase subunit epsilon
MAERLRLRLYTPVGAVLDAEVDQVTAPGAYGEIGILPKHAALATTLEAGVLAYRQGAKTGRVRISGGFAEVRDDVVTVLADSGETLEG